MHVHCTVVVMGFVKNMLFCGILSFQEISIPVSGRGTEYDVICKFIISKDTESIPVSEETQ